MNELAIPEVRVFQEELSEYARQKNPDLLTLIREKRKLEPDIEKGITDLVTVYVQEISAGASRKSRTSSMSMWMPRAKQSPSVRGRINSSSPLKGRPGGV